MDQNDYDDYNEEEPDTLQELGSPLLEDGEHPNHGIRPTITAPLGFALRETKGSTLKGTVFNLINTVIGAGILALPYCLSLDGVASGLFLIFFVALMAEGTVWMLLYCVDTTSQANFGQLGKNLGGAVVSVLIDLSIFLLNFGLCASYVIIIGDNLTEYAHDADALATNYGRIIGSKYVILAFVWAIFLFPLSMLKKMSALRHVSLLCLGFISLFVLVVIIGGTGALKPLGLAPYSYDGIMHSHSGNGTHYGLWDLPEVPISFISLLQTSPFVFFAFVCHMNVPMLYQDLRRRSKMVRDSHYSSKRAKMMCAVTVALTVCFLLYGLCALFGFILFKDKISDDILTNFKYEQLIISPYIKLVYSLLLSMSYSVMSYSGRQSLHRLLLKMCPKIGTEPSFVVRLAETLFITCGTTGIAMSGVDIGLVFGLTGSITCTALMYIFPGLFFFLTTRRYKKGVCLQAVGMITLAVGVIVMFACTVATIIKYL